MITIWIFVLGKSKSYAFFRVSPDIYVGELQKLIFEAFPEEFAGVGKSAFHLEFGPPEVDVPDAAPGIKLSPFATLTAAGIVEGARIVVVLPPAVTGVAGFAQAAGAVIPQGVPAQGVAAAAAAPPAADNDNATASSRDDDGQVTHISAFAGNMFEYEVRTILGRNLGIWLPWFQLAEADDVFMGRADIDPTMPTNDIDVFAYMRELPSAATFPLVAGGVNNVQFIQRLQSPPRSKPFFNQHYMYQPKSAEVAVKQLSPAKPRRGSIPESQVKYFIGEAYSGEYKEKFIDKLEQMEDKLFLMKARWMRRDENRGVEAKINDLVGLASVIVRSHNPANLASEIAGMYRDRLFSPRVDDGLPLLTELAETGRFCVIALSDAECCNTAIAVRSAKVMAALKRGQKDLAAETRENAISLAEMKGLLHRISSYLFDSSTGQRLPSIPERSANH